MSSMLAVVAPNARISGTAGTSGAERATEASERRVRVRAGCTSIFSFVYARTCWIVERRISSFSISDRIFKLLLRSR